jgi:ATP-dependent exoDNAse (exonuclease V) beta subunit
MVAARDAREERELLEEDRLLYVAMTRAEERLILVWTEGERPDQRWITPVNTGLGLGWNSAPGEPSNERGIRVLRAIGSPPAFQAEEGVRTEEPEAVLVQPNEILFAEPPSVSATALVRFEACPHRYFLGSLLGWPEEQTHSDTADLEEPAGSVGVEEDEAPVRPVSAIVLGDAVHKLLAGIEVVDAPAEARALAERFHSSELGQRARRAVRIGRETPVLFEFEGLLIRGVIDLWFEEGGELVIVDYKTERHIGVERRDEYSAQLGLYAIALSRALGRPVNRSILAALHSETEIDVTSNSATAQRLKLLVDRFRDAHKRGDFPLRPSRACEWCRFFGGACPSRWPEMNGAQS